MANACPCGTNRPYAECCGPLHRGTRVPETAAELMRSRYAAFAQKEVAYLIQTLDDEHEDRALPLPVLEAQLRDSCREVRLMGLTIFDAATRGDTAEVLFHAKRFIRGKNHSFVECSSFTRSPVGWRYHSGELYLSSAVPTGITLLNFREHFARAK